MFGYVIPNQAALDDEAKARYRTAYCGLCRRIGALHGLRGRLTLSYDLTFLDLLLSSLYEGESECITGSSHCPIHPIRKINWRHSGPTDYCADMSVALHYYNAVDKWNDDHSLLGLGFEKLLDSPAQTAAQRWPRQCNAIRTCLDRLAQLEAEGSEDLDAVSGCFGELMAELFDYKQDHWSPELRSIGFHLGKFIYLLDAYDDLARDEKKGAYNPLRTLSRQPGYEEEMRDIFELLLARCARSFERLPCVEDADLLRNILYSGVWLKYNCKQAKEAPKK
ncbi:MAG: DUF5685 family protein [Faecalibacterium prausnitzii]